MKIDAVKTPVTAEHRFDDELKINSLGASVTTTEIVSYEKASSLHPRIQAAPCLTFS